jgi:SAM-dependent methyltransferase
MPQSIDRDQVDPAPDLRAIQADLERFYPDIERDFTPLLTRIGYGPKACREAAVDYLNVGRTLEQVSLLERYSGSIKDKRILEVGSGFGLFVAFTNRYLGARTSGIEPAETEFESTYQLSVKILGSWSVDTGLIKRGRGEEIPFSDGSFDIVYSTNVLEHVQDPVRVVRESIRVLKPGGILQFIVPNYGSFWEGHYAVPWIPYMSKGVAKAYIRAIGRDPWFIDTLCLINYFSLKKILTPYLDRNDVEIVDWGGGLFVERMTKLNFSEWGGLSALKRWVQAAHKLGVTGPLSRVLVALKAHTPIVMTLKKRAR